MAQKFAFLRTHDRRPGREESLGSTTLKKKKKSISILLVVRVKPSSLYFLVLNVF